MDKPLREVTIKTFFPGNQRHRTMSLRCQPGMFITEENLSTLLVQHAKTVESAAPDYDYEMVKVGKGQFNFVCRGMKPNAVRIEGTGEMGKQPSGS